MIRVQDETPAGEVANVRLVQLRRLAPRGHKLNGPRRQKTPSRPIHLMLVGAERAAYAFLFVQLQGLEAYVISQLVQEGKNAFAADSPYANCLWAKPFRFSTRRLTNRPRKAKSCTEINSVNLRTKYRLKIFNRGKKNNNLKIWTNLNSRDKFKPHTCNSSFINKYIKTFK